VLTWGLEPLPLQSGPLTQAFAKETNLVLAKEEIDSTLLKAKP